MANKYNNIFKNAPGVVKDSTSTTNKYAKATKQLANKTARLEAGGVDVAKATDKRNIVEKALNLTPDQNVLFDIMEVIGRPQQAAFGAIDAAQKGEDVGKAALQGLTGDKYTYGGQLLRNGGMEDSGKEIGKDDILGFMLDIAADPIDLALVPVTAGTSLAAKAAATSGAKGLKVADKALDVSKSLSLAKDGTQAAKITKLDSVLSTLKNANDIKATKTEMKALSDLAFKGIGQGIKGTAKVTDKLIEKVLKSSDLTKGVKNAAGDVIKFDYANPTTKLAGQMGKSIKEATKYNVDTKTYELASDIGNIPKGKLETYKEVKNWFAKSFNNAAALPRKTMETLRKSDADTVRAMRELSPLRKNIDDSLTDVASKVVKNGNAEDIGKFAKKLDNEVLDVKEYLASGNRTAKGSDVLKYATEGTLKYTDEVGSYLDDLARDINDANIGLKLDYTVDKATNTIKLSGDWKKLGSAAYRAYTLDPEKLSKVIKLPTNYTKAQIDELESLVSKYKNDPMYKDLYSKLDNTYNEANKILDKHFKTKMADTYTDNAGYVRHAFNKEGFEAYKKMGLLDETGKFVAKGNTKVLGDRIYNMSVKEANNMFEEIMAKNYDSLDDVGKKFVDEHKELFKSTFTDSFDDYLKNVPKLAKNNQMLNEILVKQTFGDWQQANELAKRIKKETDPGKLETLNKQLASKMEDVNMKILTKSDSTIPSGFKVLNDEELSNLSNKMDKLASELGIKEMEKMSKFFRSKSSKFAINKDILRYLEVDVKKDANALLRLYDKSLEMFKKFKTLSPSFQFNNLIGNTSNMALGGIGVTRQAQLLPKAYNILTNADNLMKKAADGIQLTAKEASDLKIWNEFLDAGFGNARAVSAMDFRDMPESLRGYFTGEKQFKSAKDFLVDGLPYLNNLANNFTDTTARLATFIEGYTNPNFLLKLNVDNAGDAVRKILFDPKDLSTFEKDVMKRIIPFYTFTKKNLAFQISNLGENGSKYHKLMKGYKELMEGATDDNYDNVSDFLKNNMYIPLPTLGKNGEYTVIRATLPFGQLLDTIDDPKTLLSSLAPGIKAPMELALNKTLFNGAEIEKFAGEKSSNIPGLTKKQEYLLGQTTGLDTPLKNLFKVTGAMGNAVAGGSNVGSGMLEGLKDMTTMQNSVETDKLYKAYDQLDELETIMQQYKQAGYTFSTTNELKKSNEHFKLNSISAKLAKYSEAKSNPYKFMK